MSEKIKTGQDLLALVPSGPDWKIPWEAVESSALNAWVSRLKVTMQNPFWHGEGDVWTHTQMVCEALSGLPEFRSLEERKRQEIFLAALLHDFGKASCTRWENGSWTSPYHGVVGARLTPDFSIDLLLLLSKADLLGRTADGKEESLENLELCRYTAEEAGCLAAAIPFPDDFSEYAYLSGRGILPGQHLYDDTWGEIILMSGLPGTGKDTWIQENCPDLPMISLDEIRRTMKLSRTGKGSEAAAEGRRQAQEYLRAKTPFVWNATCLSPDIRGRLVSLCERYGASVRIVYLETDWETRRQRNIGRGEAERVPETAVIDMLRKLVLPERFEAHRVAWESV